MYYITVISKNKSSIKSISTFLNNVNNNKNLNLNIIKKYFQKKNKKKVFAVLKSPHVNKIAQEQFEFKVISKQFLIKPTIANFKFLLLLKKIESNLVSDIKIIIKLTSHLNFNKQNFKLFNSNNFKIINAQMHKTHTKKILKLNVKNLKLKNNQDKENFKKIKKKVKNNFKDKPFFNKSQIPIMSTIFNVFDTYGEFIIEDQIETFPYKNNQHY